MSLTINKKSFIGQKVYKYFSHSRLNNFQNKILYLWTSISLFLFNSTWAVVAPQDSSNLSPNSSNSLVRSDFCLSALALACLSASNSSSCSSIWPLINKKTFGLKQNYLVRWDFCLSASNSSSCSSILPLQKKMKHLDLIRML